MSEVTFKSELLSAKAWDLLRRPRFRTVDPDNALLFEISFQPSGMPLEAYKLVLARAKRSVAISINRLAESPHVLGFRKPPTWWIQWEPESPPIATIFMRVVCAPGTKDAVRRHLSAPHGAKGEAPLLH